MVFLHVMEYVYFQELYSDILQQFLQDNLDIFMNGFFMVMTEATMNTFMASKQFQLDGDTTLKEYLKFKQNLTSYRSY